MDDGVPVTQLFTGTAPKGERETTTCHLHVCSSCLATYPAPASGFPKPPTYGCPGVSQDEEKAEVSTPLSGYEVLCVRLPCELVEALRSYCESDAAKGDQSLPPTRPSLIATIALRKYLES